MCPRGRGFAGLAVYCVSKFAAVGFTESLAAKVAPWNRPVPHGCLVPEANQAPICFELEID